MPCIYATKSQPLGIWYGMVWYGMVWYGMVWYGMVWYGMVWYGMVWYGMVWYGTYRTYVRSVRTTVRYGNKAPGRGKRKAPGRGKKKYPPPLIIFPVWLRMALVPHNYKNFRKFPPQITLLDRCDTRW